MKTKFIAMAAAAAALSFNANAALENSISFGAGGGWTHLYGSPKNASYQDSYQSGSLFVAKRNGYGLKLNAEYNFTDWFALGLGYDFLSGTRGTFSYQNNGGFRYKQSAKPKTNIVELYGRFAYPLDNNGSDLFLKLGVTGNFTSVYGKKSHTVGGVAGLGAQWALTRNLALRVGYDYYYRVAKYSKNKINSGTMFDPYFQSKLNNPQGKFNSSFVYATLQYTFGGPDPVIALPVRKTPAKVTQRYNLDQNILFPYNSSKLSAKGAAAVSQIAADTAHLNNSQYGVYGYSDRMGSDDYNLTLSQKRADAVTAQLKDAGVKTVVTSEGRGKANPVTGDKCDSVKGRRALINCLAPDRRVEVVVTGETETETEQQTEL